MTLNLFGVMEKILHFQNNYFMSDSFSFKTTGFIQTWPSYQPDSSYSTFSDVNLLNICCQPRYSLIVIKIGIDKLLKKLNRIYFKRDVLKYILPEEIIRNRTKAPNQNLINTRISDFFVWAKKKLWILIIQCIHLWVVAL